MQVRTVAIDRDVRAPRLVPSLPQLLSDHSLRRAISIAALLAIDFCCLVLAALIVPPASGMGWTILWPGQSWWDVLLACLVLVSVAALKGLYGRQYVRHSVRKVISAWTIAFVVTLLLMLAVDPAGIGARYVAAWILACVLAGAGRFAFDALLGLVYGADGDAPPAIVLGSLASCQAALSTLAPLAPESRIRVVGLMVAQGEREPELVSSETPPVLGGCEQLPEALAATGATQVIIADPIELNGQLETVMDACRNGGVALKVVWPALQPYADPVSYVPGLDCPLFVVRPQPASAASYVVKQIADRVLSALLLVILSPILLVIAVLIQLTSRGSVFFIDERVGVGQQSFRLYKFRTMVQDARASQESLEGMNEAGDVLFKMQDDPRVTRVGRVLRRLSLDELPQLLNVLKGDMSLVGPRPLPLRDCGLMDDSHRRRHVMKPGITGLWQVSGRSDLSFDDMMRLDLEYLETWSLQSDLYIAWRTVGAIIHSRGSY